MQWVEAVLVEVAEAMDSVEHPSDLLMDYFHQNSKASGTAVCSLDEPNQLPGQVAWVPTRQQLRRREQMYG